MKYLCLLIKPSSGNCNMRCKYCFYEDISQYRKSGNGFMSEETLEVLVKKSMAEVTKQITFVFQGGEPTLVGLEFYKKLVELQKQYNVNSITINNSIQTNGYIIDDEWAKFFSQNHFLVGLSLDGTKDLHDLYRVDASDKGTFSRILKVTDILKEYNVDFNILTVVTNPLAKKAEAVYNFYKKQGFKYLQFIPCLNPLEKTDERFNFTLTPERYGAFLIRLFDLWLADLKNGNAPSIRQFDNYVLMLKGIPPESCGFSGGCSMQYVIEADGSVYPCDFYVLDELKLGNIRESSFAEIDIVREETGFIEKSLKQNEKCAACEYYPICRNGCRRYRNDGIENTNIFCRSYKNFFEHSLGIMFRLSQL